MGASLLPAGHTERERPRQLEPLGGTYFARCSHALMLLPLQDHRHIDTALPSSTNQIRRVIAFACQDAVRNLGYVKYHHTILLLRQAIASPPPWNPSPANRHAALRQRPRSSPPSSPTSSSPTNTSASSPPSKMNPSPPSPCSPPHRHPPASPTTSTPSCAPHSPTRSRFTSS